MNFEKSTKKKKKTNRSIVHDRLSNATWIFARNRVEFQISRTIFTKTQYDNPMYLIMRSAFESNRGATRCSLYFFSVPLKQANCTLINTTRTK